MFAVAPATSQIAGIPFLITVFAVCSANFTYSDTLLAPTSAPCFLKR